MTFDCPFILASGSPRRKRLLERLGLRFEVCVSDIDEAFATEDGPEHIVRRLADEKAADIGRRRPEALVLGADTIVVLDGEVLGKPAGPDEAARMLGRLSGRTHTVYTGIALRHDTSNRAVSAYEATNVTFAKMTDAEIRRYVRTGSPLDKAGAYGIQDDMGALFIPRIEGDYYNVVGLPLHRFYQTVRRHFNDLLKL